MTEGNSGSVNATFTVTLNTANHVPVTVQYDTDPSGANPATENTDYTATSGTLTFDPDGALTQTINVPIIGDTLDEPDETFTVTLSSPVSATITQAQGVGTILDNDEGCPAPLNILTADELNLCIQWANSNPGADTLGLGGDITLNAELTHITSEITLNGNSHYVSGADTWRVFYVESTGNLTLDAITVQNGN